ncbi:hypothetical protein FXW78_30040 [Rhodococcus opacus]|nr:hypothetical protein [Rhodococcus opacus]
MRRAGAIRPSSSGGTDPTHPPADRWEEGFGRLLDYVEHHGHARVRYAYTIDDHQLGSWVTAQRHKHAQGTLDTDRERRLQELPGWTWNASSSAEVRSRHYDSEAEPRLGLSLARVMGPPRCHEHGTTRSVSSSIDLAF